MKLVEFLQGKWLGHPLHPAIVHVPVGGWIVACALDVASPLVRGSAVLEQLALWCVGVGLIGALVAVPPGVADWSAIKKGRPAWKLGLYHLMLNLSATLVWAVNFGLRYTHRADATHIVTAPILITSIVGVLLVIAGAYLGLLMVFDQGIGIARTSKKKWRQIAERAGARVPEEK